MIGAQGHPRPGTTSPPAARACARSAARPSLVPLEEDAIVADAWLDAARRAGRLRPPDRPGRADVRRLPAPPQRRVAPRAGPDATAPLRPAVADRAPGQWSLAEALAGPCLLMRRRVLEAIGVLGEGPGLASLADRGAVRCAGFALAVCPRRSSTCQVVRPSSGPAPSCRGVPAPTRPAPTPAVRVSLTMIVRDEEANLPALPGASAAGLFDELDRGRHRLDGPHREIAAVVQGPGWSGLRLGRRLRRARNAALGHATGDYAFWLDADDVHRAAPAVPRLEALFDGLRPGDEAAYVVPLRLRPRARRRGGHGRRPRPALPAARRRAGATGSTSRSSWPSRAWRACPVRWTRRGRPLTPAVSPNP